MKIYVKNAKINNISHFFTRITTYNWDSLCYNALILTLQWKYLIFRLIFIQKLNLFFFEFQNIWLIKNLKSPVRLTLFIKIFYNEALVIKTLVLTIGVIICHKSSQIRLMINHMLLKIQIYYRLTLCLNCSPLKFKFKKFKFWILFFNLYLYFLHKLTIILFFVF